MEVRSNRHTIYRFGEFSLAADELMIYRGTEELAVPPKAVETLLALIVRRGDIVSKDELMEAIWSDAVVEESNLSRYIHVLRTRLGAQPDGKPYIETFRRRGYRFGAEVQVEGPAFAAVSPISRTPVTNLRPAAGSKVVALAEWQREPAPDTLEQAASAATVPTEAPSGHFVRNFALAVAAIGVIAVSIWYLGSRSTPALTDRDVILMADIENRTGDEVFDGTIKQGLMIQLQQSPYLSIYSDEGVRQALELMKREKDTQLTRDVAREICQRQALKAYITGSITQLDDKYVLTTEARSAADDSVIASEQVSADGKGDVLRAVSATAESMRRKLGESLASIEKLSKPLQVTTSSLEALRLDTIAFEHVGNGQFERAIAFYKRAIETDPEFASAYGDLAVAYNNSGRYEEGVEAIRNGYALVDHVSERERLNITDLYYSLVTAEMGKRIEVLELYKQLYPRDFRPRLRLASVYSAFGENDLAIAEAESSVALGSSRSYLDLGQVYTYLGKFAEARDAYESGNKSSFDMLGFHTGLVEIGIVTGDDELVRRELDAIRSRPYSQFAPFLEARIALARGRFARGMDLFNEARDVAEQKNLSQPIALIRSSQAIYAALYGRCDLVTSMTADAERFAYVNTVLARSSLALTLCGYTDRGAELIERLLAMYPNGENPNVAGRVIRAASFNRRGEYQAAIDVLRATPPLIESRWDLVPQYLRGTAYLGLKDAPAAVGEFRKILDNRGEDILGPIYPLGFLGLARSLALSGDISGARDAYSKFFELWKEADDTLPVLREAKKEFSALGPA